MNENYISPKQRLYCFLMESLPSGTWINALFYLNPRDRDSSWAGLDMGDQEPPEFGSLVEELKYWKEQAAAHQQRCVVFTGHKSIFSVVSTTKSIFNIQLLLWVCWVISPKSYITVFERNYKGFTIFLSLFPVLEWVSYFPLIEREVPDHNRHHFSLAFL